MWEPYPLIFKYDDISLILATNFNSSNEAQKNNLSQVIVDFSKLVSIDSFFFKINIVLVNAQNVYSKTPFKTAAHDNIH
jgi:hypothetical protein